MFNKENTKIFIDTNIFLNLYNSNDSGNVKAFMKALINNKNNLITTEQAFNEYLRRRTQIIEQFKKSFIANRTKEQTSSFVRSLIEYKKYSKCLKELHNYHKMVVKSIDDIISDANHDYIYKSFIKLWKSRNTIKTTDKLIELAIKRKSIGNPPGGDKYTNGDELIWEALINNINMNLIIVSKDGTYSQNKEYLKYEYKLKTQHELVICDTVSEAFSIIGIEMDQAAIDAEDHIRWLDIVIQALNQLGGQGTLSDIYSECRDLVSLFYTNKMTNNNIDSTIRRTIYQHSSDVTAYLGKRDIFHQVDSGVWELRNKGIY